MAGLFRILFVAALALAAFAAPAEAPTKKPTAAPTKPPTKAPTEPPTAPPTKPPTKAPTEPPTKPPTAPPTEPPKPCPCDVCFQTWHAAKQECTGNMFHIAMCRMKAFDRFVVCWFRQCIVSTEACASRPLPDIDDDDDEDIIVIG